MGLDMYLSAEKYISGWDHNKDEAKASFAKILEAAGLDSEDIASGSPSGTLSLNVMYWRKPMPSITGSSRTFRTVTMIVDGTSSHASSSPSSRTLAKR